MSSRITDEIIARQAREVQTIIRLLLVRIAELEGENAEPRRRIEQLERQAKGKTPQNSSLPLEHPTSAPPPAAAESLTLYDARTAHARNLPSPHRSQRGQGGANTLVENAPPFLVPHAASPAENARPAGLGNTAKQNDAE